MLLRSAFILFITISYSSFANSDHDATKSMPTQHTKVLILGDSLSAGYGIKQDQAWVQLLQNAYRAQKTPINLINASISGETTGGALQRLPMLLEQHTPNWVLIELGGNDGLRGYPIKLLKQNLENLITITQAAGANVLLMQIEITPNLGPRYANLFKNTYKKLANSNNIPLIPFFIRSVAVKPNLMLPDGIHPNAKAQPKLAEIIKNQFDKFIIIN